PVLYPLSLHDALPISFVRSSRLINPSERSCADLEDSVQRVERRRLDTELTRAADDRAGDVLQLDAAARRVVALHRRSLSRGRGQDRKSTRLNSSHDQI